MASMNAVFTAVADFSDLDKQAKKTAGSMRQMGEAAEQSGEQSASAGSRIRNSFSKAWQATQSTAQKAGAAASQAMQSVQAAAVKVGSAMKRVWQPVQAQASKMAAGVRKQVGGAFRAVGATARSVGSRIGGALSAGFGQVRKVSQSALQTVGAGFSKLGRTARGIGQTVGQAISDRFPRMAKAGQAASSAIQAGFGKVRAAGSRIGAGVRTGLQGAQKVGGQVSAALQTGFGKVRSVAGRVGGGLQTGLQGAQKVGGKVSAGLQAGFGKVRSVTAGVGSRLNRGLQGAGKLGTKISSTLQAGFAKVRGVTGGIGSRLSRGLRGAGKQGSAAAGQLQTQFAKAGTGVSQSMQKPFQKMPAQGAETGAKTGSRFGSSVGGTLTKALGAIGLAGLGAKLGGKLMDGFRSAVSRQNVEASLKGLLGGGQAAADMMDIIDQKASNIALPTESFQELGKTLGYMDVEGKEAAGVMENVGKAVVTAGKGEQGMQRASEAMLSMTNAGKVYTQDLQRISDAGIPIFDGLAEHYDKSVNQVRDMVENDKVAIEDVMEVMEKGEGDIFKKMKKGSDEASQTLSGQFTIASNKVKKAFAEKVLPVLDRLAPAIGAAGSAVASFMSGASGLGSVFAPIKDAVVDLGERLSPIGSALKSMFSGVGSALQDVAPILLDLATTVGSGLYTALQKITPVVASITSAFLGWLKPVLTFKPLVGALAAGLGTLMATTVAYRAVVAGIRAVTMAWTVAQTALNAVMMANPLTLIIAGLAALAAGLVVAYQKSETFRNIVNAVWGAIKTAALATVNWFKDSFLPFFTETIPAGFRKSVGFIKSIWNGIKSVFLSTIEWIQETFGPAWNALASVFSNPIQTAVRGIKTAWNSIKTVFLATVEWLQETFAPVWNVVSGILSKPVKLAVRGIKAAWGGIKTAFLATVEWVQETFAPIWNTIKSILSAPVKLAVRGIKTAWAGIKTAFMATVNWVIDTFAAIWNTVKSIVSKPIKAAWSYIKKAFAGYKRAFLAVAKWVKSTFNKAWATVKTIVATPLKAGWRYVKKAWKAIKGWFSWIWKWVSSTFKKAWSTAKTIIAAPLKAGWRYIRKAWKAIKGWFSWIWKWVKSTFKKAWAGVRGIVSRPVKLAWRYVKKAWKAVKGWFSWIWKYVKTAFKKAWAGVRGIMSRPVKAAWSYIKKAWAGVKGRFKALWGWVKGTFKSAWAKVKGIFSRPVSAVVKKLKSVFGKGGTVRTLFGKFVKGAKGILGKLKNALKKPINAAISGINGSLIKGINWLLKKVGVKKKSRISKIPTFRKGGYTGAGRPDDPAGQVERDEYVVNSKSRRRFEKKHPGYLKHINETGEMPSSSAQAQRTADKTGERQGGVKDFLSGMVKGATGVDVKKKAKATFPTKTRAYSNNYSGHSGVDIRAGRGETIRAISPGSIAYAGTGKGYGKAVFQKLSKKLQAVYGHMSKITKNSGKVSSGTKLGEVGSTGNSTGPHLHFEVNSPGKFGSSGNRKASLAMLKKAKSGESGGGWLDTLKSVGKGALGGVTGVGAEGVNDMVDKVKGWWGKLKGIAGKSVDAMKGIGSSPFAEALKKIPGFLWGKAKGWLKDKAWSWGESHGGDADGDGTSAFGKASGSQASVAKGIIKQAKDSGVGKKGALVGLMTAMQESMLKELSGGDRDSVGPFQQRGPWGSKKARMATGSSAKMFFEGGGGGQRGLKGVSGWKSMSPGKAAQAVQISAFPGAYSKHKGAAKKFIDKYYAAGGPTQRGVGMVGDDGPELVGGPELRRLKSGQQVLDSRDTMRLLSGMEAGRVQPANAAAAPAGAQVRVESATVNNGSTEINMPIYYPRDDEVPAMAAQRQIKRAAHRRGF